MDILNSIARVINVFGDNSFYGKLCVGASALATAYFTPIVGLLFSCFAFTIMDLVFGLQVAKKAGKKLTSSKSWTGTLTKIKQEFVIIALCHLLEHAVMGAGSVTLLSGGATVLICLTELWSIIENLNTLDPTGPWKILKKYLKKKGEDYVGIELEFDKDGKLDNVRTKKRKNADK